jgi:hypothetical protein
MYLSSSKLLLLSPPLLFLRQSFTIVVQAGLELATLLPQPPKCWDCSRPETYRSLNAYIHLHLRGKVKAKPENVVAIVTPKEENVLTTAKKSK